MPDLLNQTLAAIMYLAFLCISIYASRNDTKSEKRQIHEFWGFIPQLIYYRSQKLTQLLTTSMDTI